MEIKLSTSNKNVVKAKKRNFNLRFIAADIQRGAEFTHLAPTLSIAFSMTVIVANPSIFGMKLQQSTRPKRPRTMPPQGLQISLRPPMTLTFDHLIPFWSFHAFVCGPLVPNCVKLGLFVIKILCWQVCVAIKRTNRNAENTTPPPTSLALGRTKISLKWRQQSVGS